MEMIDVLQKLKEIQESRPGVVDDAVASVESFNPKTEGAVKGMVMDMEQDAVEMSKEEFVKKHGSSNSVMNIWNKVQKEKAEVGESKHTKKSVEETMTRQHFQLFADTLKQIDDVTKRGKTAQVIADVMTKSNPRFDRDKFMQASGVYTVSKGDESVAEAKPDFLDMDKDGDTKEPMTKAIKDKETMKEEDAYDNDRFQIKAGRAIKDNSGTADKKDHVYAPDAKTALKLHGQGKKVYKEAIQISTDSPEEATMMMRMLQMAGIRPLDQDMINQPAQQGGCGADEAYANEPDVKVQDTDTLVNFHSGGLNRQKRTFPKVAGGDNPMQKTESLADSLRTQYAEFKTNYQTAVTEAKKSKSPYAVGMAQAMKSTGDQPPLKKATIKKAHDIAKAVKKGK